MPRLAGDIALQPSIVKIPKTEIEKILELGISSARGEVIGKNIVVNKKLKSRIGENIKYTLLVSA